ncbi:putative secreted protein [Ixodes scapularis]
MSSRALFFFLMQLVSVPYQQKGTITAADKFYLRHPPASASTWLLSDKAQSSAADLQGITIGQQSLSTASTSSTLPSSGDIKEIPAPVRLSWPGDSSPNMSSRALFFLMQLVSVPYQQKGTITAADKFYLRHPPASASTWLLSDKAQSSAADLQGITIGQQSLSTASTSSTLPSSGDIKEIPAPVRLSWPGDSSPNMSSRALFFLMQLVSVPYQQKGTITAADKFYLRHPPASASTWLLSDKAQSSAADLQGITIGQQSLSTASTSSTLPSSGDIKEIPAPVRLSWPGDSSPNMSSRALFFFLMQDGAIFELGDVVLCALKGIGDLNLGSQLYTIVQLLDYVSQRNNLGIVIDVIRAVCQLPWFKFRLNCNGLRVNTGAVCGDPIEINLPSVLGAGQCVGTEFQTCENGQPVTGSAVQVLFDLIQCLLKNLPEENLSTLLPNIICSALQIIEDAIGKNVVTRPIISAINELLQTNCTAAGP